MRLSAARITDHFLPGVATFRFPLRGGPRGPQLFSPQSLRLSLEFSSPPPFSLKNGCFLIPVLYEALVGEERASRGSCWSRLSMRAHACTYCWTWLQVSQRKWLHLSLWGSVPKTHGRIKRSSMPCKESHMLCAATAYRQVLGRRVEKRKVGARMDECPV